MLVTGLHDGNVAVYNLQLNTSAPVYQSSPRNGKHRDVVWQVREHGETTFLIVKPCPQTLSPKTP